MAFLRFHRDKRGYEHFYLVEPTANRRGKVRARVLYWFRTPPNIKVGREPFDAQLRSSLEAQYPDVSFDWKKIIETPLPSADVERWRERRRQERAEKAARQAFVTTEDQPDEPADGGNADMDGDVDAMLESDVEPTTVESELELNGPSTTEMGQAGDAASPTAPAETQGERPERRSGRRRRRRGRRGRSGPPEGQPGQESAPPTAAGASNEAVALTDLPDPLEPEEE